MSFIVSTPKNYNSQIKKSSKSQFVSIVGTRVNSRGACVTCKLKKRKCDELKPQCMYCKSKGFECGYNQKKYKEKDGRDRRDRGIDRNNDRDTDRDVGRHIDRDIDRDIDIVTNTPSNTTDIAPTSSTDFYQDITISLGTEPEREKSCFIIGHMILESLITQDNTLESMRTEDNDIDSTFPLLSSPSSNVYIWLKDKLFYLDYFHNKLAQEFTISIDHRNQFQRFYSTLAHNEESFTFILAGWSALYLNEFKFNNEIKSYFQKGIKRFQTLFRAKNNGYDYFFQIFFYIIMSEIEIGLGGTKYWRQKLKYACELVTEYGGLEKFCEDFCYNHDIRFMVSTLQHLDVLSSNSMSEGTIFPIDMYRRLFDKPEFRQLESGYGVDPFQGCHQQLMLVLGDIMNYKIIIDHQRMELNLMTFGDYNTTKNTNMKFIRTVADELELKIRLANPNITCFPQEFEGELEAHRDIFDLLKICCFIYLNLYIKRITPNNFEIQELVSEALVLIEKCSTTTMAALLIFPLLICGICVNDEPSKLFVETMIEQLRQSSYIMNVDKGWMIIQRSWQLNPDGNTIVDWSKICEEYGWELNIC